MEFKSLIGKATSTASAVGAIAEGKLIEWMDDYNRATAVLATLGFEVGKFRIAMGVLPEVHTTLAGKVADIRKDRVEALMQEHACKSRGSPERKCRGGFPITSCRWWHPECGRSD